ncbi:MAG: hypothetical protein FJ146_07195 [Deltaproteobacteria bacterium]|nr:hypothetical protein [Deltaproteobacteria bacterium]
MLALAVCSTLTACNKAKFLSQTATKKADSNGSATAGGGGGDKGAGGTDGAFGAPPTFSLAEALSTSQSENAAWVVNSAGIGYKISLDAQKDYPMVTFSGLGPGGHRTFATKYGLFVGTTAGADATTGKIYYVPRNITEGGKATVAVDLNTLTSDDAIRKTGTEGPPATYASRICVIVYTINGIDYLGASYTAENGYKRKFYRAPIDITKPGLVDTSKQQILAVNEGGDWGYSCAYDPKRNYFYSKSVSTGGGLIGVDLTSKGTTMTVVSPPNAGHKMTGPANAANGFNFQKLGEAGGSYAMGITTNGDIVNDSSARVYTMAHEPLSGNVFVSLYTSGVIHVTNDRCFKDLPTCGDVASTVTLPVDVATGVPQKIGPLSSLNDGRVLGLHRGTANGKSALYMFSMKEPKDRTKGINITKIKEVDGDAYMYTDFTGSMSAAREESRTLDLTKASGFQAGKAIKFPRLKWKELPGTPAVWKGLTLAVACTTKGTAEVPLQPIANVPDAGVDIDLSQTEGCKSGAFDEVRIQVKPSEAGVLVFSKTREFVFSGQQ